MCLPEYCLTASFVCQRKLFWYDRIQPFFWFLGSSRNVLQSSTTYFFLFVLFFSLVLLSYIKCLNNPVFITVVHYCIISTMWLTSDSDCVFVLAHRVIINNYEAPYICWSAFQSLKEHFKILSKAKYYFCFW